MNAAPAPYDTAQLLARAARTTPDRLMHHLTAGKWKRPRHVRLMGEVLSRVQDGDARIILEVTVRHGKSWLGSWALPVWYLDLFPGHHVAMATYQANFSARWGRLVRNTITREADKLRVRVADDSAAAHSWETTEGGGMHTAGVGGEFTGRGFQLILIDDPIKNAAEANSEVQRENVWAWYQSTVRTRLEPGGSIVLIMARWHEDDLAGRLIQSAKGPDGEQWDVVRLPAVAEEDDALGREPGEPLWPERYNTVALKRIEAAVGPSVWGSLYQQRPSPADGGKFKRSYFRYFRAEDDFYTCLDSGQRVPKTDCWRFETVDTAYTEKTQSDYTVRMVWDVQRLQHSDGGYVGGAMFLVDLWRERLETPKVEAQLKADLVRFKPLFIGLEAISDGATIYQRFQRDGLPARRIQYGEGWRIPDKVTKATLAEVWMSQGKVYFPADAACLGDLEHELLTFPNGAHDDQVDALAMAVHFANNRDLWIQPKPQPYAPGTLGAIAGHDRRPRTKPTDPFGRG